MPRYKNLSLIFGVLVFVFAVFSGFLIHNQTQFVNDNHFILLAESFIHNDLFLSSDNLPPGDFADYQAKQYLFFGPVPSVILIPFVYMFGTKFPQMFLSLSSLIIIYLAIFSICRKLKFDSANSLWLANFFVFGTVLYFVSLINISAYTVQAVGVVFVALALLEYFGLRRWFVIGILVALAGATRVTLFGVGIFFAFELIRIKNTVSFKKSVLLFAVPILISVILLGAYNWRRFNSVFDTGYTRNVTVVNSPTSNYQKGSFSPVHIPGNLYNLLLATPEVIKDPAVDFVLKFPYLKVNGIGLALFVTSPLFVYLVKAKKKSYTPSAFLSIIAISIPSLVYFGIGTTQFGYRYSLDFQPFLFLILLSAFEKGVDRFAKFLIVIGIFFNCFYMASVWNSYPVFSFLGLL